MGRSLKAVSLRQIVGYLEKKKIEFEVFGDLNEVVYGFSSISRYQAGTLTWLKVQNKQGEIPYMISICVVQKGVDITAKAKIISSNSKAVFFSILERFWGDDEIEDCIGEGTVIGKNVFIGNNVYIGCNCSIRGNIRIENNTTIGDNVVIRNNVTIGRNCDIQSLCVIGEDGYGYSEDEFHVKTMIKHYGGVIIEDDVFIGSHTNIARGTIDDTVIKRGVKIAPSTHIGHNGYIGENAAIVCSRLFGSVKIGENAYISSSIVRNQTKIGSDVIVGMGSVVTKDIEGNKVVMGAPAKVMRENNGQEKI